MIVLGTDAVNGWIDLKYRKTKNALEALWQGKWAAVGTLQDRTEYPSRGCGLLGLAAGIERREDSYGGTSALDQTPLAPPFLAPFRGARVGTFTH
jgi:hypothetical protein